MTYPSGIIDYNREPLTAAQKMVATARLEKMLYDRKQADKYFADGFETALRGDYHLAKFYFKQALYFNPELQSQIDNILKNEDKDMERSAERNRQKLRESPVVAIGYLFVVFAVFVVLYTIAGAMG